MATCKYFHLPGPDFWAQGYWPIGWLLKQFRFGLSAKLRLAAFQCGSTSVHPLSPLQLQPFDNCDNGQRKIHINGLFSTATVTLAATSAVTACVCVILRLILWPRQRVSI